MRILTPIINILFPLKSLTGREGSLIEEGEWARLRLQTITLTRFDLVHEGVDTLQTVVACAAYDGNPLLKTAVHRLKYNGVKSLSNELGAVMADALRHLPTTKDTVLCPVPLHWRRLFDRGFNQSALLSDVIGRRHNLPVQHVLKRVTNTQHQAGKTGQERRQALLSAFSYSGQSVPEHVVLIDDVATTFATLQSCARVLHAAGVKRIDALVLALG